MRGVRAPADSNFQQILQEPVIFFWPKSPSDLSITPRLPQLPMDSLYLSKLPQIFAELEQGRRSRDPLLSPSPTMKET